MPGIKAFTAAVLGGIGNLRGAMLGGLLLGLFESLGTGYLGELTGGVFGSNYQDVFAFLVLIAVLVFRPPGCWANASPRAHEDITMTVLTSSLPLATPRRARLGLTLFILALLLAPWVAGAAGGNYWVRVVDFALLYLMLALGLNIVVGMTGLLDMGFIAFTPLAPIWPRCCRHRI